MKVCSSCKKEKPFSEYHPNKRKKDGYNYSCKGCIKTYQQKYRKERFHVEKNRRLVNLFKMTLEEYENMLISQGGGCAICGMTPEENGQALAVDHLHSCCKPTGKNTRTCGSCIRGLLCSDCNQSLGKMRDDPARLRRAAEYLERNEMKNTVAGGTGINGDGEISGD